MDQIDCVMLECGHMCTCTQCGKQMAECPICRQYVVRWPTLDFVTIRPPDHSSFTELSRLSRPELGPWPELNFLLAHIQWFILIQILNLFQCRGFANYKTEIYFSLWTILSFYRVGQIFDNLCHAMVLHTFITDWVASMQDGAKFVIFCPLLSTKLFLFSLSNKLIKSDWEHLSTWRTPVGTKYYLFLNLKSDENLYLKIYFWSLFVVWVRLRGKQLAFPEQACLRGGSQGFGPTTQTGVGINLKIAQICTLFYLTKRFCLTYMSKIMQQTIVWRFGSVGKCDVVICIAGDWLPQTPSEKYW